MEQSGRSLWTLALGNQRLVTLEQQLNQFNLSIDDKNRAAKYAKMGLTPFVFFRGTAHLYYHDLHQQQVLHNSRFFDPDVVTWIQGDLHVENYGAFCDGQGDVIFDLNDFDESWVDSYLYDIYRLATSMILVIEQMEGSHLWDKRLLIKTMTQAYQQQVVRLSADPQQAQVKITADQAYGRLRKFVTKAQLNSNRRKMLDKWTVFNGSERKFDFSSHKLEVVDQATRAELTRQIEAYHYRIASSLKGYEDYFKVVDVAKREHAGTGSLGTTRYYVLIDGHNADEHDHRILDVKMQGFPSYYPYLSNRSLKRMGQWFDLDANGSRVSAAQEAMHVHADDHLGSVFINEQSYSVRERSPYKKTLDSSKLNTVKRFSKMAQQWGSILASAHVRAALQLSLSASLTHQQFLTQLDKQQLGQLDDEIFDFANAYAQQVGTDHQLFLKLLAEQRI